MEGWCWSCPRPGSPWTAPRRSALGARAPSSAPAPEAFPQLPPEHLPSGQVVVSWAVLPPERT
ncbi:Hypothetical protein AA314_07630 [Archangium gephyra]|uniref:Uncharacterized protein n=1 Tax=Archangium gephyra TaxID=48 RepID=A0AAC8QEI7_9BACT|nr:Hypothetical protein AA314_07630 [Archangium gephyra]